MSNLKNPAGQAAFDIEDIGKGGVCPTAYASVYYLGNAGAIPIASGADFDVVSLTQVYAPKSLAVVLGYSLANTAYANCLKFRLYADGVQIDESAYMTINNWVMYTVKGYKALVGSKIVKLSVHNYDVAEADLSLAGQGAASSQYSSGVFAGSVKLG